MVFLLVHSVIGSLAVASSSRFQLGDFVSSFSPWGVGRLATLEGRANEDIDYE